MKPGPNPSGVPWELVMCRAIGCFALLLFLWRSFQCVRNRLYVEREKQLALKLSGRIEEKCELLEKVSLVQKDHEVLESTLKGGSIEKGPREAPNLEATYKKLHRSKPSHGDERLFLKKELKEQKAKHCKQDEIMADISKRIKSLEGESESLRSQIAETKTNLRLLQMSEEGLILAMKEALDESSRLQQSQKPILQGDAEAWREQGRVQCKESTTLEDSQVHAEKVRSDKENHMESLTEGLLKMKDRSSPTKGAQTDIGNLEWGMTSESGIGAHLDDEPKGALKKLVDGAKLKASLETLEGQRYQTRAFLSEVEKTKEDLREQIRSLKTEEATLLSENTRLEGEKENLQQKVKVMMECYQENMMKLHGKLRVEENYRVEQEEKLSKVKEEMGHTREELETYRKRAKYLKEELERTIQSSHESELAAWIAERNLHYFMKQNARNGQKLTERELQFELVEEDPCALGVSNAALGRKHSPNGPSPLRPPWQGGCYSNYGRPSRPAELRGSNMPSLDKEDGPMSSESQSSRKETKIDLGDSNVPDSSLPAENQATGSCSLLAPFPPVRGELFPVDPRSQFMRRGPFFPPPPPGNRYGAPRDYFPPGPPPPPFFPMPDVYEWRYFPHDLPPRAGFLPPPPHSESRSECPSGFIPPSSEPATEHQQET
ncbi:LOW QUALITY PROTEIN: melanoma inhibitory activity protein 2-like [Marmota marmota marmota]|uniref:LOW QUALITY PROTEIN: melanoma inhibitory activity protein 2-like n=1 Tax=Marmota marmota marmota TaxID=9994 RepID=UPI002093B859|nr:LOW QUALITY PROTEIN: melanoma inhibitory activity protein 2-like [Marmota marmota marmota]